MVAASCALAGPAFAAPRRGRDPVRPDLRLTPGVIAISDTAKICGTAWGKDERHVTEGMKQQVFASYGIPWTRHDEFEVDHLISRELGGADAVANLWPESYGTLPFNAHSKDRLENLLHKLVCARQLTLQQAQNAIRRDWIAAYKRYEPKVK